MLTFPVISLLSFLLPIPEAESHFESAEHLFAEGKYHEAMIAAGEAADCALEACDTATLIKAYCLETEIALDAGLDMEAVDHYNKCIDLSSYIEPMFLLSSSLFNIASIYYKNGENDKALEYIMKSIQIDSRRNPDSILALRYFLAAEILYEKGEYQKSIEMADTGKAFSLLRRNKNIEARLELLKIKCREAMSEDNPKWPLLESEYRSALETLNTVIPEKSLANPYEPEFLYRLGLAVAAQGLDARQYFIDAINSSKKAARLYGGTPLIEIECCRILADTLLGEGDEEGAKEYLDRAESLSYVPYVQRISTRLSLSQLEFIRHEKDMEIQRQRDRMRYLLIIASIFAAALVCLALMYRYQHRQKRTIETKNAQLVKLDMQKSQLIEMLQETPGHQASDRELNSVLNDKVPVPVIKLSTRESEVLELCCKGLMSKEIAARLCLSVRTVESHKVNLFRKFGVNTTNELIAIAFKTGRVK